MKRIFRINQIMRKFGISEEEAEKIFIEEICEKYGTENVEMAEMMYQNEPC